MIVARQYQKDIADQALAMLREYGLVYIAMEERTGKSLTAILVAEDSLASKVLIVTKKKALEGWEFTINNYIHVNSYTVINYESVHKVSGDFDLVILDEPHDFLSSVPKKTKAWSNVRKFTRGKPIIYTSATPCSQGKHQLFHQFKISDFGPYEEYENYYKFYNDYAEKGKNDKFKTIYIAGAEEKIDYTAVQGDKIWEECKHLFITKTRKELGFEYEPNDVIHYIELSPAIRNCYNILVKDKALSFTSKIDGQDYDIVCDSPSKLRTTLHMLEGGGVKIKDKYIELDSDEKISFIKKKFGDTKDLVIMYSYIVEGIKLRKYFKHAEVLQGDTYAEGVDLHQYKHLVIYSQSHRVSKHIQRRARQSSKDRKEEINVHYLLVRRAVSDKVYRDVSLKKKNHVDRMYERI